MNENETMIAPAHRQFDSARSSPTRREAWEIASSRLEGGEKATQSGLTDRVTDTVGRHPLVALVAATAVGLAAGWFVKRKL